jgi:hypothetical protein
MAIFAHSVLGHCFQILRLQEGGDTLELMKPGPLRRIENVSLEIGQRL